MQNRVKYTFSCRVIYIEERPPQKQNVGCDFTQHVVYIHIFKILQRSQLKPVKKVRDALCSGLRLI